MRKQPLFSAPAMNSCTGQVRLWVFKEPDSAASVLVMVVMIRHSNSSHSSPATYPPSALQLNRLQQVDKSKLSQIKAFFGIIHEVVALLPVAERSELAVRDSVDSAKSSKHHKPWEDTPLQVSSSLVRKRIESSQVTTPAHSQRP